MTSILNFSDLGCLNESAAGSLGAGMASFVRAEFPAVRGFIVTPLALSDFLKRADIAAALDLHSSGAESPDESWRAVRDLFGRTRMGWSLELEILTAYSGIGSVVSIAVTSRLGTAASPVYGLGGEEALAGIKHCWLRWLKANIHNLGENDLPAVIVREVQDSEVSVELRKKGQEMQARAVFGLPEGLHDPNVSSDIFEFGPEGKLDRMEMRPQTHQFIMGARGPSLVDVDPDFREEEKLSGAMIESLAETMAFLRENPAITGCSVCFVSSRPVVCSATRVSDAGPRPELPSRQHSISLLKPTVPMPQPLQAPVVAARMFLRVEKPSDLSLLGDTYADGILVTGNPLSDPEWINSLQSAASEAKRRFRASFVILEAGDTSLLTAEGISAACTAISANGMKAGLLIPGIRSGDDMAKVLRVLGAGAHDASGPAIWARVMYPSNLYFMDSLAQMSDVLALDLDSLGRLMLGAEHGRWVHQSSEALEKALAQALSSKKCPIAVLSEDLVSMPGLLEFLIRGGADIICSNPQEMATVRHIVASVEKRIIIEQGRA